MTYPLISIIVRTYNRPLLLTQALHSLAQQDYRPLEIVIINDGGIDITNVIREFQALFTSLHLHQLPQQMGRAAAANTGLEVVNGQFIGFLDDDDVLDANHLTNLYAAITQYSVQAVYSGVRAVKYDADGNEKPVTEFRVPFDNERLYAENFIPIHAVLFAHELILKGCKFDTSFELFEDWDFWLQLSQHTKFHFVDQVTATYRLNDQSSILHSLANRYESALRIYTKWLANWPNARLHKLLARMYEFKDNTIAVLQHYNEARLQAIGMQHTYACQMVEERDRQLQEFVTRHDYAVKLISERDQQLQEFATRYEYAVKIINERDHQLREFTEKYDYTLQVINEKDQLLTYIQTKPISYFLEHIYNKLQHILKI